MKNYLLAIVAVMLATSSSAFTVVRHSAAPLSSLYWYDQTSGTFLGFGELPNNGCMAIGTDCARGFNTPQSDPLHTTPVKQVAHN